MADGQRIDRLDDIPGWFSELDQAVFEQFLGDEAVVPRGDLVEIGAYLGKSAVLIGRFKRPEETFTVCDPFGMASSDDENRRENARHYSKLQRADFERNYLAFFDELPVIVQDFSSEITQHVQPASARFVHVDGSHRYEQVAQDVESARTIVKPDGVVVFDDYRSTHTPGVAAAVWDAVLHAGLNPICITVQKLYGTFGDPEPHQQRLAAWLATSAGYRWETQPIAGKPVIRMDPKKAPPRKSNKSQLGDSLPPPASFDLVGSYARRRGPDVEIVLAEPKIELSGSTVDVTLASGTRRAHARGDFRDGPHGRRLVVTAPRHELGDGTWTLDLDAAGGAQRLDARLLVQGERPLVLLWGATGSRSLEPENRMTAKRQAAAAAGRALDRALSVLPEEQARRLRAGARTAARRVLR